MKTLIHKVGLAFDVLGDPIRRARYYLVHLKIQLSWVVYKTSLQKWKRQQEALAQRQVRLQKLRLQRQEAEAKKQKDLEAEQRRLKEDTDAKKRWKVAQNKRDQIKRELEASRAETRQKQAQKDCRLDQVREEIVDKKGNQEESSHRMRWCTIQERNKAQAMRAEAVSAQAAEERLKNQQRGTNQHNKQIDEHSREQTGQSSIPTENPDQDDDAQAQTQAQEERLAKKQCAADKRQESVLEKARLRQAFEAEKRLQYLQSLKRTATALDSDTNREHDVKRLKPEIRRGMKIRLAREWAYQKHEAALEEVGGIGYEQKLEDKKNRIRMGTCGGGGYMRHLPDAKGLEVIWAMKVS